MIDLQPLINAINSFKPEWYEQYLFPVIGWVATLGAGVALTFWALKINENHRIEKENLLTTNSLLLTVDACISHLINVKKFYASKINANPVQRALAIPAYRTIDAHHIF